MRELEDRSIPAFREELSQFNKFTSAVSRAGSETSLRFRAGDTQNQRAVVKVGRI